ncbi:30S ribosomal protein S8 [Candidatus Pacearchaeota archaeon]|nr:30S ribosomal protein S8 [Candidatus Pacearchaeota archaeon]|tara:strand:+ start:98 stop:472 length:375 start_codon:yes stop_codon:yes gene_type:complete
MAQDKVSDALNMIMNAKRARKTSVEINYYSKLLTAILAIAKLRGYIKDYKVKDNLLTVELGNIHGCKAIKPRYLIPSDKIEKYISRYLPARNLGILIISTSEGLMTHQTAIEKNLGGSLIAYLY